MGNFFATTQLKEDLDSIQGGWALPFVIHQQFTNPMLTDNKQEFQVWKFNVVNKELGLTQATVEDGNNNILFIYYLTENMLDKDIEFIFENDCFCYFSER